MRKHDFEQSCAFLIHDTARLIRRQFDGSIRDLGLTEAKWRVLAMLRRMPGLRQCELAELLDIERAPLGFALDWLERKAWIRREPDPLDRRARRVHLEPQAEPTLTTMEQRFRQVEANYLRGFDEGELAEMLASLRRLRAWLRAHAPHGRVVETLAAEAPAPPETYLSVLFECSRLLTRRFSARLAEFGFTRHQWLVLNTVERREGLRQTELAEATALGTPAVGKLVDALQTAAWLERRVDTSDRRANRLYLSSRAHELLAATRERFEQLHEELGHELGAARARTLVSRLGWIRQRLLEETVHSAAARSGASR